MTKNQYSSETVKLLLENEKFNFWSSDWSKKIIVHWHKGASLTQEIKNQLYKLVGKNFMYERSLSNNDIQYDLTKSGLIPVTN